MTKIHVVIPDAHAHYKHHNKRADYVGRFIADIKPDTVIDIGDSADFPSLSSYDKGKRSFHGRTYAADVASYLDFQDRLWSATKRAKRKLPLRVRLIGNHEQRIDRALELQPELDGAIGYADLELERYYDIVVPYNGGSPGVIELDGIHYAHYFTSGVLGKPVSGEHPAHSLLQKKFQSCTQGHNHTFDYKRKTKADGTKINGLIAGCLIDYNTDWAGEPEKLWDRGVAVKTDVENGDYSLTWVSLATLKRKYG